MSSTDCPHPVSVKKKYDILVRDSPHLSMNKT